jgi:hypothetical protein
MAVAVLAALQVVPGKAAHVLQALVWGCFTVFGWREDGPYDGVVVADVGICVAPVSYNRSRCRHGFSFRGDVLIMIDC